MIFVPLGFWFYHLDKEAKIDVLRVLFFSFLMLSVLLGIGMLAGCTTTKPVEVPVPVACVQPKLPPEPNYPYQGLKKGDSPATVIKAYVATVAGQHDYIQRVKYIIGSQDYEKRS